MKICWLQEKCGAFGGAEANVLWTAGALAARGFENHLLCTERTGIAEERWTSAFQSIRVLAPDEAPASAAAAIQPGAIWIHNWTRSGDFQALCKTGIPAARMVHDHAMYCMRHYKYHPLTRKNCTRPASPACVFPCMAFLQRGHGRFPVRIASYFSKLREIADNRALDRVVIASEFMRGELLKNRFAPEKIHLLPPVPPESAEILPSGEDPGPVPGRILYVGQVIRGKGVDLLVRALAGLSGDWHFALAGRGGALPKVEALIDRLGIRPRTTIYGHLAPSDLARLYREAQVVVVPSAWQEPFGMVGIEAMRQRRAVVAFASGGIPDWLEDGVNGLLAPTGDVDALRAAIARLLANPELAREMGLRGAEIASRKFSFQTYTDRLEGFLKSLALARNEA